MPDVRTTLQENLKRVEDEIAAACARAGRNRVEVTLVAVTKYVDVDVAATLVELGVTNLGESRPQELWRKAEAIPQARWHLIGHLQRNKVERSLAYATLVHSIDSLRLLEAIEAEARKQGRIVEGLLEFNLSGEANKHGFQASQVAAVLKVLRHVRHVRITGLMTMAALGAEGETARPTLAALRQLRDRLQAQVPAPHDLAQLSMGMTSDFAVAIEEGATLVRIGSALFQGLLGRDT